MANYFYTDVSGNKQGPVSGSQIKEFAKTGQITPQTIVETEDGKTFSASKVRGLTFADVNEIYGLSSPPSSPVPSVAVNHSPINVPEMAQSFTATTPPSPFDQTVQVTPLPQPTANHFCTNCGNSVSEQAVACMSCGCKPSGHKKFCRHCGVALNSEQIICIKCGTSLDTIQNIPPAVSLRDGLTNSIAFIKNITSSLSSSLTAKLKPSTVPTTNQTASQNVPAPPRKMKRLHLIIIVGIAVLVGAFGIIRQNAAEHNRLLQLRINAENREQRHRDEMNALNRQHESDLRIKKIQDDADIRIQQNKNQQELIRRSYGR